jgi:hypothetical protein
MQGTFGTVKGAKRTQVIPEFGEFTRKRLKEARKERRECTMDKTMFINVNELAVILGKHFQIENVTIEGVRLGKSYLVSKEYSVGTGRVCTLRIDFEKARGGK